MLIVADIDHFKQVNDRFGHTAGDEVLCLFADILRNTIRDQDLASRWGGEEFAVILQGATPQMAQLFAESARSRFAATGHQALDGEKVTASFGIAMWKENTAFDNAFALADEALYAAKNAGRDRVRFAETAIRETAGAASCA